MPPSPVVVEVPAALAPRPSASLACADSDPKLMPAMVMGILSVTGLRGEARADGDVGRAALAVAFERIAADRGAEEQQVVEMRQPPLGAATTDVVDAGRGRAANLRDRVVVEGRRLARRGVDPAVLRAHQ